MSSRKIAIMSGLECLRRLELLLSLLGVSISSASRLANAGSLRVEAIWMAFISLPFLELRYWDWRISFELEVDTTPMLSFSSPVEGGARRVYKHTS